MTTLPAPLPIEVPSVVSARARAWAVTLMSLEPRPRTPEDLAPYLQALIDDEKNRALLAVEKALVEQIT